MKQKEALVRELLGRVADKWTLVVIEVLATEGELRFSRLREQVGGVSQKMLTKTLRQLERDGLVRRRVHAVVPPRVDYTLTPMGEKLGEAVCPFWTWVEKHIGQVERSRRAYDRQPGAVRERRA
jgi:DNA-binding HxlR family transcriptional regulator